MYVLYGIVLKEHTIGMIFKSKSLGENLKQLINIHQIPKKKCDFDHIKSLANLHVLNIRKTDPDSKGFFLPQTSANVLEGLDGSGKDTWKQLGQDFPIFSRKQILCQGLGFPKDSENRFKTR